MSTKKDCPEMNARWVVSTSRLDTLLKRMKDCDFEKEVIKNVYSKFPDYVKKYKPLKEIVFKYNINKNQ